MKRFCRLMLWTVAICQLCLAGVRAPAAESLADNAGAHGFGRFPLLEHHHAAAALAQQSGRRKARDAASRDGDRKWFHAR
jgi:hypothetical protein